MADQRTGEPSILNRLARIAYAFVIMNTAAVMAAFAVIFRRKVWR